MKNYQDTLKKQINTSPPPLTWEEEEEDATYFCSASVELCVPLILSTFCMKYEYYDTNSTTTNITNRPSTC